MGKHFIVIASIVILLGACSNVDREVLTQEALEDNFEEVLTNNQVRIDNESVDRSFFVAGQTAELATDAFVTFTNSAYEELYDLYKVDYSSSQLEDMIEDNTIELYEEGTEVEVLDVNMTEIEVAVPGTEQTGYIHTSLLTEPESTS
ncbi:hypothetical protein [Alkalihalobacillus deserti]|uniref:hypothetical protein n=1 Tax=Alkalihalobacillus deserti TaxID=2879466 RepID=UPI001D14A345|nr:hypothetical protein [Alkalihalobacillus deserti]